MARARLDTQRQRPGITSFLHWQSSEQTQTKRLTIRSIENLKPRPKPYEVPDGGGLYLTVRPSGSKSFNLRYSFRGRTRNLTLGPSIIGLAKARELTREALVELARGKDPGAAKQEAKAAAKPVARDLVETVIEEFIGAHVRRNLKPSTQREAERMLRKETTPWWGRCIRDIGPPDVHRLLDGVIKRGSAVAANRTLSALRRFFRWSKDRQIILASPCADIGKPTSERGRARERILDDGELRLVWEAAGILGYPYKPMIRLLILTGQRRGEVAGARWSELDLGAALWTIPSARSKNHRQHTVPLSPLAIDILQGIPPFENSDFVFATAGGKPIAGFSYYRRSLDAAIKRLNGGKSLAP